MPITITRKDDTAPEGEEETTFTKFIARPNWFALEQTDGEPFTAPAMPEWDRARALEALEITEVPFRLMDGNVMGYAEGRTLAISPLNKAPHKTTFHELGHILLGHTDRGAHGETLARSEREAEAEGVALLCCDALGLEGAADCRGYIQGWTGAGFAYSDKSAGRVIAAAQKILAAGRPAVERSAS
jgi:hypothetical protein